MNEYVIIYQNQTKKQQAPAIESFLQHAGFRFNRLGDGQPYLGHIQSEMDTDQIAGTLRADPLNKGSLLFSVNKAVLV
jgi:hypothetical protein